MKNKILIIHTINGLITIVFYLFLLQAFRFVELPFRFTGNIFIITVVGLSVVKTFLLSQFEIKDPIRSKKIAWIFSGISLVLLSASFIFKIMHWPYSIPLAILALIFQGGAFILSIVLKSNSSRIVENSDLLDDKFISDENN